MSLRNTAILLLLFMVLISLVSVLNLFYYYYYYYYPIWMSPSQVFLPGTSLEPAVIPTAQASKLHIAVLSVLCVMFQV